MRILIYECECNYEWMYVWVWMYKCKCACMYVFMSTFLYAFAFMYVIVGQRATCVCVHVWVCIYVCVCLCLRCVYVWASVSVYVRAWVYVSANNFPLKDPIHLCYFKHYFWICQVTAINLESMPISWWTMGSSPPPSITVERWLIPRLNGKTSWCLFGSAGLNLWMTAQSVDRTHWTFTVCSMA